MPTFNFSAAALTTSQGPTPEQPLLVNHPKPPVNVLFSPRHSDIQQAQPTSFVREVFSPQPQRNFY